MVARLIKDEQNPAYDLLSKFWDYLNHMAYIISEKRKNQIITFLKSLKIKSTRFSEVIKKENISMIQNFNQIDCKKLYCNIQEEDWLYSFGLFASMVLIIKDPVINDFL